MNEVRRNLRTRLSEKFLIDLGLGLWWRDKLGQSFKCGVIMLKKITNFYTTFWHIFHSKIQFQKYNFISNFYFKFLFENDSIKVIFKFV